MTEQDLVEEESYDYEPGGRRRKSRGAKGCLAVIVALAVLAGGFYFGLTKGVAFLADQFQGPEDYPGPGSGKVEFTVNEGDVVAQIGRNLKADGVTASVHASMKACTDAVTPSALRLRPICATTSPSLTVNSTLPLPGPG